MLPIIFFALITLSLAELAPITKDNPDYSHWDAVLKKLVKTNDTINGVHLNSFNYAGLTDNEDFKNFTYQVENADDTGMNFDEFKAFWVNVYNYLAVRLVFENPCANDVFGACRPLLSIREVGTQQPSLVTNVWEHKYLHMKKMNITLSLDDIENNRLRNPPNNWTEDARIHSAIVCASVSCPNLRDRAYFVETIEEELTSNAIDFLANPLKGSKVEGDSIRVSAIFSFFPEDFNSKQKKTNSQSIPWFLAQYGPDSVKQFIKQNPEPTLFYFTYDWDLNGSVGTLCSADRLCFPWWSFVVIGVSIIALTALFVVIYKKSKRADYEVVN